MNSKQKIVAIDLFCGVGGLSYGLQSAGVDVQCCIDIDKSCKYPIETNIKSRFLEADVARLAPETLAGMFPEGKISLLAGCAPCQPFSTYSRSVSGSRNKRTSDTISDDWKLVAHFGDLVRAVQPDLVTMENVPPLMKQPVFQKLLHSLQGYWVDYRVVECEKVGLPQTRKRLVLVASKLGTIKIPLFEDRRKTVRETIGKLPALAAGQSDPNDKLHRASRLSEKNLARVKASRPGGTWRDWPKLLRAHCHRRDSGATYPSVYGRMAWDEPAPTITTQCFGFGNGRFGHPEQDRAISLREAAMLQGFPESYEFLPPDMPVSFAKIGTLIGNAVPVTLGKAIGETLQDHVKKNAVAIK